MELLAVIGNNRCAHLRWKGLYVDVVHVPEFDVSTDYSLWCNHTHKCVGPDGQLCDHIECTPERECYEQL
jgi:hypothetical protein